VLAVPAVVLVPDVARGLGVGLVLAGVATVVWQRSWKRWIGGINGDVVGAAVEIREIVLLAAMSTTLLG
jgi:cobalamin synthase